MLPEPRRNQGGFERTGGFAAWDLKSAVTLGGVALIAAALTAILYADFWKFKATAPGGFGMEAERQATKGIEEALADVEVATVSAAKGPADTDSAETPPAAPDEKSDDEPRCARMRCNFAYGTPLRATECGAQPSNGASPRRRSGALPWRTSDTSHPRQRSLIGVAPEKPRLIYGDHPGPSSWWRTRTRVTGEQAAAQARTDAFRRILHEQLRSRPPPEE